MVGNPVTIIQWPIAFVSCTSSDQVGGVACADHSRAVIGITGKESDQFMISALNAERGSGGLYLCIISLS